MNFTFRYIHIFLTGAAEKAIAETPSTLTFLLEIPLKPLKYIDFLMVSLIITYQNQKAKLYQSKYWWFAIDIFRFIGQIYDGHIGGKHTPNSRISWLFRRVIRLHLELRFLQCCGHQVYS
jgi:hypothetical protein